MKKSLFLVFLALTVVMTFTLTACGSMSKNISEPSPQEKLSASPSESKTTEPNDENSQAVVEDKSQAPETRDESPDKTTAGGNTVSNHSDVRVKLSFYNEEVVVKMEDNPTSRDFLTLLPLTCKFEDYNGTEKISNLPRKLSTQDAPSGIDPAVGDLTLYAPWGNLAIFYRDYGFSSGLIKLGHIESGIEKLASIRGDFTVKIEKVD